MSMHRLGCNVDLGLIKLVLVPLVLIIQKRNELEGDFVQLNWLSCPSFLAKGLLSLKR